MSETIQPTDEWLPVKDVAQVTGVTIQRIYNLVNSRRIAVQLRRKGSKDAKVIVVRADDVRKVAGGS